MNVASPSGSASGVQGTTPEQFRASLANISLESSLKKTNSTREETLRAAEQQSAKNNRIAHGLGQPSDGTKVPGAGNTPVGSSASLSVSMA